MSTDIVFMIVLMLVNIPSVAQALDVTDYLACTETRCSLTIEFDLPTPPDAPVPQDVIPLDVKESGSFVATDCALSGWLAFYQIQTIPGVYDSATSMEVHHPDPLQPYRCYTDSVGHTFPVRWWLHHVPTGYQSAHVEIQL